MRTKLMFAAACFLIFLASAIAAALIVAMLEAQPAQQRMEIRWYQMCIPGEREGWSEFGHCPRKFWNA